MAADPTSAPTGVLHEIVTDAHRHAAAALREGSPLDGVVWLSAHVAATGRAFAGSRRRRAGHRGALRRHEAATRRLEHLLRVAERRHSGDALAAGLDSDRLTASLERALSEHERAECEWLRQLESSLSPAEASRLAASYLSALEHAPTRPHPYVPHGRVAGAIAFRVDALRDRVMDTMDARHVPLPRRPARRPRRGRWSSYLLGQMDTAQMNTGQKKTAERHPAP